VGAVNVPRQRRAEPVVEPVWCATDEHHTIRGVQHVSKPVEAGERYRGGAVRAWLVQRPGQPAVVAVNAAQGTGVTVQVPLTEVESFARQLLDLVGQAGTETTP
jgi:hypothetical protein